MIKKRKIHVHAQNHKMTISCNITEHIYCMEQLWSRINICTVLTWSVMHAKNLTVVGLTGHGVCCWQI